MAGRTTEIPQGPIEACPAGFVPGREREAVLRELLSSIELGAWDQRIVDWLAGWDTSVVVTVVSWLARISVSPPQPDGDHEDTVCRSEVVT